MSVSVDSTVVAAKTQVSADLQGEAVVLGIEKGVYYGLDEVAARVWELLREPRQVSVIRDAIVSEYDVDVATCQRDLLDFLNRLEAEKLIEVSYGQSSQISPTIR